MYLSILFREMFHFYSVKCSTFIPQNIPLNPIFFLHKIPSLYSLFFTFLHLISTSFLIFFTTDKGLLVNISHVSRARQGHDPHNLKSCAHIAQLLGAILFFFNFYIFANLIHINIIILNGYDLLLSQYRF